MGGGRSVGRSVVDGCKYMIISFVLIYLYICLLVEDYDTNSCLSVGQLETRYKLLGEVKDLCVVTLHAV